MRRCTVVTDPEAAVGFRLAGVEALAAGGPAEAERLLRELLAGAETSIVLVSQGLLEGVSEALRRRLARIGVPIVVPIPISPEWWREDRAEDYILEVIRRAIGFQMRIGRTP